MELRQYFSLVWKWAWLIVLSVAIAAVSSYVASKAATPLYRTLTTLMIGRVTQTVDPNSMDVYLSQQLANTYIQLVRREPVLKGAVESLGLNMDWRALAGQVSASTIPQTQFLQITVIDSDPYRAKAIADAVADQMVLLSPGSANQQDQEVAAFTKTQLDDLKKKIEDSKDEITRLRQELDAANSARQIQDLQTQVSVLENKISGWQSTYAQLLLTYQGGDVNVLSVIERAQIPGAPFSPNTMNNVLVAAAIGLVLALGGALLIEYLDDTIKNPDDAARITGLPNLASIPVMEGEKEDYPNKLVAATTPLSPVVESYRVLRTNLQFSMIGRPVRTIMITSPSPSEGKSISLANLAVVLAQAGRKVILVDTDLRRPTQHRIFGLPNRSGLTDALLDFLSPLTQDDPVMTTDESAIIEVSNSANANPMAELFNDLSHLREAETEVSQTTQRMAEDAFQSTRLALASEATIDLSCYLQKTTVDNLLLLSTGSLPPNPTELLGSELMGKLIVTLKAQADLVLFDSPPTLIFADAAVLSTKVDGVIIINDMGRTRTNEAQRAVEELKRVHANLLGTVLNRAGGRRGGYGYNYYSYYYYYYRDGEKRRRPRRSWLPFEILRRLPGLSRNHNQRSKEESVPGTKTE